MRLAAGVLALTAGQALWALPAVAAASPTTPGATVKPTDPTFVPSGTRLHYQMVTFTNPNPRAGKYTFSLTTNGFQAALYLYQSPFLPDSSPSPNLWALKTTGNPVKLSTQLTSRYQSTFVLVIASTSPVVAGSYNLSISGPTTLSFPAGVL